MKRLLFACSSALFTWACAAPPAAASDAPTTVTATGPVKGADIKVDSKTVHAFKGIPFAAPPLGPLRWRPPQPPASWDATRDCLEFAPACLQPSNLSDGFRYPNQSEDCLYLNVWTPTLDPDAKRPVMVWIHGGGNAIGGASAFLYDGRHFAASGVVLVSIQYRLGAYGYLAHPALTREAENLDQRASSGNYGLMDQVMALQWVRDNIAQFGGDPSRVTIFGESAGEANVTHLMASPLARGLFHRAIAESGYFGESTPPLNGPTARPRQRSAHEVGLDFAARLGVKGEGDEALAQLRAMKAEKLLEVPLTIGAVRITGGPGEAALRLGPVVDGYVLPRDPEAVWREGDMARVPFIAGSQLDDGSVFSRGQTMRLVGYRLALRAVFGPDAARAAEIFPAPDEKAVAPALHRLVTLLSFRAPARRLAAWVDDAGGEAYLYHFSRNPNRGQSLRQGVFHGLEIGYVFKTLSNFGDDIDRALAQDIHQRWINFAATGDPNQPANPQAPPVSPAWPRYTRTSDQHLELGDAPSVGRHLDREACDLLDKLAERN